MQARFGLVLVASLAVGTAMACTTTVLKYEAQPGDPPADGAVLPTESEARDASGDDQDAAADAHPLQAPCKPKNTCGTVACGTIPDGCGGTLPCGSCNDSNACTVDSCAGGQCVNTPRPDLTSCGNDALCAGNSCAPLHAKCIANNPNARSYYTYWITPDPQGRTGWTVGDDCVCNGNTLETLFNGDLGPTITVPCSKCMQDGPYGNTYCFK